MKRAFIFLFFGFIFTVCCYSQNANVTVRVTNIQVNGGKVYLAVFANANSFRNEEPEFAFELQDTSSQASQAVSLPPGEYVIAVFQDANNNQKLDYNLVGIPRELVGISNYSGRGFPSKDFNKQKIRIDASTGIVTVGLHKF